MRLGLAVSLLPLANPLQLAEETATVDHISKGRLVLGVGRSSFIDAYQGYNVDYGESRPRFFECLEILQKAWGDEPFSWEGEFYNFHDVNVVPKPYQQPHPPVRIACESQESFEMMGRFGHPLLIRHQMPLDTLKGLIDGYQAERLKAGGDGPVSLTLQAPVYVAETSEQARADTEEGMKRERAALIAMAKNTGDKATYERFTRVRELTYSEQVQREGLGAYPNPFLFGSPEEVADRLLEYEDRLGLTGICMTVDPGGISPDQISRSLHLLADKVMPKLK
jgi:alkanesulfonate monooxygenase SsuD/methylene tetrahydromethanopterin reductase-like flavin-dependent oxidoreductase (luciferase family)